MLVLALDTSSPATSCALVELEKQSISDRLSFSARLLAGELALPPAKAGDLLPEVLATLCARAGRSLDEVGGLAAGLGPGSFTGLRVGLASAKGLAYARRWPLAGCSSLRALALGAVRTLGVSSGVIVSALEARRGELFLAAYSIDAEAIGSSSHRPGLEVIGGERVLQAREVASWLAGLERPLLIGPGAKKNLALLREHGVAGEALAFAEKEIWPSAAAVAELCAEELFASGFDAEKLFSIAPLYLAQSEAEKALAEGRVGKLPAKLEG